LIDGTGAIVSAFLLGVVLVEFEHIFGIPQSTLYCLASFPCLFAIYDFCCYWKSGGNSSWLLNGIAFMNLLYCCFSIGLVFYHHQKITHYGWIYIVLEISVIGALAILEFKTANTSVQKK
jgi:hypothetical protein